MFRTDYSLEGYCGLRMAEENRLAEYWPEDYESHSPGPKSFIPIDEVEDSCAIFDHFDVASWRERRKAIIADCQAFRAAVTRRMFQVSSMQELYALVDKVGEWDDSLPKDFISTWEYLADKFERAEMRVRALIRKTRDALHKKLLRWVRDHQNDIVHIGTATGFLFSFHPKVQYVHAWMVINGDKPA